MQLLCQIIYYRCKQSWYSLGRFLFWYIEGREFHSI